MSRNQKIFGKTPVCVGYNYSQTLPVKTIFYQLYIFYIYISYITRAILHYKGDLNYPNHSFLTFMWLYMLKIFWYCMQNSIIFKLFFIKVHRHIVKKSENSRESLYGSIVWSRICLILFRLRSAYSQAFNKLHALRS